MFSLRRTVITGTTRQWGGGNHLFLPWTTPRIEAMTIATSNMPIPSTITTISERRLTMVATTTMEPSYTSRDGDQWRMNLPSANLLHLSSFSSLLSLPVLSSPTSSLSLLSIAATLSSSTTISLVPEWLQNGLYWISTLKRRRKMMNKHKLRKRRKKNRMKTRK